MPCTAKKGEILRPDYVTDGRQDTDFVLTTTEIIRMIKQVGVQFDKIEGESADMPFSLASGGGAIFGVTGGVTEAVLRRLSANKDYQALREISFTGIRGEEGIKEAVVDYEGREVRIAIVNGLSNAGRLLERMKAGEAFYDFVEIMACKRGCIMGGGQPGPAGPRTKQRRMEGIYKVDMASNIKSADENPAVTALYQGFLKGKEHRLLHRNLKALK